MHVNDAAGKGQYLMVLTVTATRVPWLFSAATTRSML
jgi:hypothetical protein